jgi:hypothetical protein
MSLPFFGKNRFSLLIIFSPFLPFNMFLCHIHVLLSFVVVSTIFKNAASECQSEKQQVITTFISL